MFWGIYFPVELVALSEEVVLELLPQELGRLRESRWDYCGPPQFMLKLTVRNPVGFLNRLHRYLSAAWSPFQ